MNYQRLIAELRFSRSELARQQGRLATARAEADAAIAAARAVDDRSQAARGLNLRGSVLTLQGDYREARASFEESATIARGIGEKAVYTAAIDGVAGIDLAQGHVNDARRRLEEIVPIDRKTGDKSALARRLANLSAALGAQGHPAEAGKVAAEECAIHESLAATKALTACRVRLAELWWAEGRQRDARTSIDRIGTEVSLPPIDLARLAGLYLRMGDAKRAAATIADARRALEGPRIRSRARHRRLDRGRSRRGPRPGRVDEARRRLALAKSEAERLGLLPLALEAKLTMVEKGTRDHQTVTIAEGKITANRAAEKNT